MKEHNYEALVAGMHKKETFEGAEAVMKKDFKLKLPDRRYIHMWSSPEIGQFRGVQELMDKQEATRGVVEREKAEIRQVAREQDVPTPDMSSVHEALHAQRQRVDAMTTHADDLRAAHEKLLKGQQAETRAELVRLGLAQEKAVKTAKIAEEALSGLRDVQEEDRARLSKLAQSQGVVHNHIDQSVVNNTQHVHQDTNIHNQVMHIVNTHTANIGSYMQQQQLN
mgnify:FL=1